MNGVADFFVALVVILIVGAIAWVVFTQLRARRLGLSPPSLSSYNPFSSGGGSYSGPQPARGGVVGWFNDQVRALRSRGWLSGRKATGNGTYEEPLQSGTARGRAANRGFGPLDPDDAWDARVGTEADAYGPGGYYEEQEIGLHDTAVDTGYAGARGGPSYDEELQRGRGRTSREPEPYIGGNKEGLDRRYDEEMGVGAKPARNPFEEAAEPSNMSLRGVSPRPVDTSAAGRKPQGGSTDNSPSERVSMFTENV